MIRAAWWVGISSLLGMAAAGCSSSSGGPNLDDDCNTLCGKVSAAGCMSESDCISGCEDTSSLPSSCLSAYDALVACGASAGTVTCTSGGESIGECESQAQAVSSCASGNTTCPSGSYTETCVDIQGTGSEVSAQCRAENGSYVSTQLTLPCSYVSNCNGQLSCATSC